MRPRNSGAAAPSPPSPFRRQVVSQFDLDAAVARAVEVFGRELIFDRAGNARKYPEVHQLSVQATVARWHGTVPHDAATAQVQVRAAMEYFGT